MSGFLINPFVFAAGGDFESIATMTVGSGGAASMEFTSIPGTYRHLQVRILARDDRTGTNLNSLYVQVNGDTGSNYVDHYIIADGSSVTAGAGGSPPNTEVRLALSTTVDAAASIFGANVVDILDYSSTTKNTTVRNLYGADLNGSGTIRLRSGLWMSTAAVTSLKFYPTASASFAQHSTAALYGIKA